MSANSSPEKQNGMAYNRHNHDEDSGYYAPDQGSSDDEEGALLKENKPRISTKKPETEEWMSRKVKAIVFINLYCILDTADNINVKIAMEKDVFVMDLAFSRILFNFISACGFVYYCKKHLTRDVINGDYKFALTYRSVMLLAGQILNVYAISLLPLSLVTIIQNT